ncbi:MAG: SUMF1/EgtB/PvdO family nonheme iron enzyme [Bacteroidales bacterium]|nr:SUMF1/EgtB/PvdO family nonheme iron enzyme [Bacteroidales bacterium]
MKKAYLTMILLSLFLVGCKPDPELPTVSTQEVSEITANSAKVSYSVSADGGAEVTSRGVCMSMTENPTINDVLINNGEGLGTFTAELKKLTPNTTYYVKAYAINSAGASYGEELEFVTLAEDSDDDDDNNGDGDDNNGDGDDNNGDGDDNNGDGDDNNGDGDDNNGDGDDNNGDGDDNNGDGDDNNGDGDDNNGDGDDNNGDGDDNNGDGDDNNGDGDDNNGDGDDNNGDDDNGDAEEILDITVNGVTFNMILVKSGTFYMGAQKDDPNAPNYDEEAWSREAPVHQVTLSDYYIAEAEVTQELWMAVMGSNPSHFEGAQRPVEQTTWYDCQSFINKLNQMTGMNFRFPTEAEWEFAARGGNDSNGYKYSGSDIIDDVAWYSADGKKTGDVMTKKPNELGIYDMSGNVMEWCSDAYGDYTSEHQTDPTGPNGVDRVVRGGCCLSNATYCRVALRNFLHPGGASYGIGMRLALSL